MEFSPEEATQLTKAISAAARHHAPEVSQKWIDYTALLSTAATLYGTRLYLIADRKRNEAINRRMQGDVVTGAVYPIDDAAGAEPGAPNGHAPSFPGLN